MNVSVVSCPSCGGPVTYGGGFCGYCRVPLAWDELPSVNVGALLTQVSFANQPPPSKMDAMTRPDGLLVKTNSSVVRPWFVPQMKRKDACVTLRAVAFDENTYVGIYARRAMDGGVARAYRLDVASGMRTFRFLREVWNTKVARMRLVQQWERNVAIAPPLAPNKIELRFADSVFKVLVNDVRVATIIDPGFGFGEIGWHVGSHEDAGGSVLIQGISVHRVA
jgi:hypothetical protein